MSSDPGQSGSLRPGRRLGRGSELDEGRTGMKVVRLEVVQLEGGESFPKSIQILRFFQQRTKEPMTAVHSVRFGRVQVAGSRGSSHSCCEMFEFIPSKPSDCVSRQRRQGCMKNGRREGEALSWKTLLREPRK